MRNKKTIALAMAAATVAPIAVPAFAAEVKAVPATTNFNLREVYGNKVVVVSETNIEEYFRANKDQNPKKIAKKTFLDGTVYYAVELNKVLTDEEVNTQARQKVALEELKKDLIEFSKETYTHNNQELPKYKIEVKDTPVVIGGKSTSSLTDSKKTITVKDLERSDSQTITYTLTGIESKYYESLEAATVELDQKVSNDVKELSKIVYQLEQAGSKIYVTTKLDAANNIKTLNVFLNDKTTKVATVTIKNYDKNTLNKTMVKLPSENDFTGHWAEDFIIDAMLNKDIDAVSNFRSQDSITRAEFVKMIFTLNDMDVKSSDKEYFSDVKPSDWHYEYVARLATLGVIDGDGNGQFRPNDTITRQEAAKIIAKLNNVGETISIDANGNVVHKVVKTKFEDTNEIAAWADESVKALQDKQVYDLNSNTKIVNIINGYKEGGKEYFKPSNNINRAEALVMITRGTTTRYNTQVKN